MKPTRIKVDDKTNPFIADLVNSNPEYLNYIDECRRFKCKL